MEKILVTGATGGIGCAVVAALKQHQIQVAVHGRTESRLAEMFPEESRHAGDLITPGVAASVVDSAWESLGGLDAVIHCVGVGLIQPAAETSDADFSRVLNINTRATFLVAQAACRRMAEQKRGLFVTFPGILGRSVMKNAAAYCASKFAVAGMLKVFAQEYQRAGIRFSLLYLGGVDTPFWDSLAMKVQREKMIPPSVVAEWVLQTVQAPPHLVMNELVVQPDSHQLF
jgi:NAD(P)-dependent dehydrogenase (short-subunit alcohol dehydrogenase family)